MSQLTSDSLRGRAEIQKHSLNTSISAVRSGYTCMLVEPLWHSHWCHCSTPTLQLPCPIPVSCRNTSVRSAPPCRPLLQPTIMEDSEVISHHSKSAIVVPPLLWGLNLHACPAFTCIQHTALRRLEHFVRMHPYCVYLLTLMPNKEYVAPQSRRRLVYYSEMQRESIWIVASDRQGTYMWTANNH